MYAIVYCRIRIAITTHQHLPFAPSRFDPVSTIMLCFQTVEGDNRSGQSSQEAVIDLHGRTDIKVLGEHIAATKWDQCGSFENDGRAGVDKLIIRQADRIVDDNHQGSMNGLLHDSVELNISFQSVRYLDVSDDYTSGGNEQVISLPILKTIQLYTPHLRGLILNGRKCPHVKYLPELLIGTNVTTVEWNGYNESPTQKEASTPKSVVMRGIELLQMPYSTFNLASIGVTKESKGEYIFCNMQNIRVLDIYRSGHYVENGTKAEFSKQQIMTLVSNHVNLQWLKCSLPQGDIDDIQDLVLRQIFITNSVSSCPPPISSLDDGGILTTT